MSCAAYEDVPIDDFDPDYFHCPVCGRDTPVEYLEADGYLCQCAYCLEWSPDE